LLFSLCRQKRTSPGVGSTPPSSRIPSLPHHWINGVVSRFLVFFISIICFSPHPGCSFLLSPRSSSYVVAKVQSLLPIAAPFFSVSSPFNFYAVLFPPSHFSENPPSFSLSSVFPLIGGYRPPSRLVFSFPSFSPYAVLFHSPSHRFFHGVGVSMDRSHSFLARFGSPFQFSNARFDTVNSLFFSVNQLALLGAPPPPAFFSPKLPQPFQARKHRDLASGDTLLNLPWTPVAVSFLLWKHLSPPLAPPAVTSFLGLSNPR